MMEFLGDQMKGACEEGASLDNRAKGTDGQIRRHLRNDKVVGVKELSQTFERHFFDNLGRLNLDT